jgi:SAM-dependent methyltransferase
MPVRHSDSGTPVYEAIGGRYQDVKDLPSALAEQAGVEAACGDVTGLDVLDLACGTGFYTRVLGRLGARRVLGVDLSPAMVEAARHAQHGAHPTSARIDYQVHDASVLPVLGSFPLITAVWLLNYAVDESAMTAMLTSVRRNLADHGRFVGVTQSPWFRFAGSRSGKYGWTFEPTAHNEFGTTVHAIAHTDPPIEFPARFARPEVYSRCALAAGLAEFEWLPVVVPPAARDRFGADFWADFQTNPHLAVFRTRPRRPSVEQVESSHDKEDR